MMVMVMVEMMMMMMVLLLLMGRIIGEGSCVSVTGVRTLKEKRKEREKEATKTACEASIVASNYWILPRMS